ncbi:putative glycosyl transferase, family 8, nucleotide-diphospho-sugar transferase [Helianthus annuus]|nr:putative glycosyl transferase, family 8, nucleotide-diphospho-sugar transferase [Helianthus annuus]
MKMMGVNWFSNGDVIAVTLFPSLPLLGYGIRSLTFKLYIFREDSVINLISSSIRLWSITLNNNRVIGAPEYCHANFTKYFTQSFWSDPVLSRVFSSKTPCYFNTDVMVMDMVKWRGGKYRRRIEN